MGAGVQFAVQPPHQTKQRFVYQALRDAIMRCALPPGQRLIIEEIAHELGVSPIPVREALRLLQSEGLIENVPHTGAIVAPVTHTSVVETFTVLEGLEVVSARTAARRMTADDARHLDALLAEMDATLDRDDRAAWGDGNTAFHRAIVQITALPLLIEMTERALGQWDRVRRSFFRDVLTPRVRQAQHEHHAILAAMRAGDETRLDALLRAHNQSALAAYVAYMEAHPAPTTSDDGSLTEIRGKDAARLKRHDAGREQG